MSASRPELEKRIAQNIAEARQAWPGVEVDEAMFFSYVADHFEEAENLDEALDGVNWAELYLSCACGSGDARALAAFDDTYLSNVSKAVAGMGLSASDVDDIRQRIREKLFVAESGERPRIDRYAGGGSLRGLVKVMAVREAISLGRKRAREVWNPDDELLRLPSTLQDPELDNVKGQLRQQFREAFEEAVDELSSRERNLLRMHLLEGVTLDDLATTYSVHRVTISRWLAKARHSLLSATRKRLESRAGGNLGGLDSFFGMVESRIDLSLSRLLSK